MGKKTIHGVRLERHRINVIDEPSAQARRHNWSLVIAYSNATEETTWWNDLELALAYLVAQYEATQRAGGF